MVRSLPPSARNCRDSGLIPESGRFPGVGNDNLLQYSCLENPMDRGVCGAAEIWTRLSEHTHTHQICGHRIVYGVSLLLL